MPKSHIITGLDLGTKHIKILVAQGSAISKQLELLGCAVVPSCGIRRGVVVNIEEVSKKITEALALIQQQVPRKIKDVYVNVGGTHLCSIPSRGTVVVSRADQRISKEDVNRVIQAAQAFPLPSNKEILDIYPQEFIVDGQGQIREPVDMQGVRLEAEVLVLCGFSPYIKNLTSAVLRAELQILDVIPSLLASARAVLTSRQKELGVCLIDIGAGTTNLAVYEEGNLIHLAVFPVGSDHITNDIAVYLKTDVDVAEKIKQEFGACLWIGGDKKEKVELPQTFENSADLVFSRKMLSKIIEARVTEIFSLIQKELKQIKVQGQLPAGVVLTGGGVKLSKITELAKKNLKLPCRLAYAVDLVGLEEDPIWSTAAGLVIGGHELIINEEGLHGNSLSSGKEIFSKIKKIFKIFVP